jgi:hypothetical protein
VVVALVPVPVVVLIALLPAGAAWVAALSSVNAAIQLFLPGWVKARGLAMYQIVFAGGQAGGALAWGVLGSVVGLVPTLVMAGVAMLGGAATIARWPLRDVRGMNRDPAVYWPEPVIVVDAEPLDGPILVSVDYTVPAERVADFVVAMQAVRRSRLRTGASRWGLYRQGETDGVFTEVYLVPTWDEHLRQHYGRLTGSDQAAEAAARALVDGPPQVTHLLPVVDNGAATPPG